jgi:hypothetical protein
MLVNTFQSFLHSWLLSSSSVFSGIRVNRSLVLCVCFVDRCLSFFFWPLCCLSFDLRILIIPLVSSNSAYAKSLNILISGLCFLFYYKHIYFNCLNCEQKIYKQNFVQNVCRYVFIAEIWNFVRRRGRLVNHSSKSVVQKDITPLLHVRSLYCMPVISRQKQQSDETKQYKRPPTNSDEPE